MGDGRSWGDSEELRGYDSNKNGRPLGLRGCLPLLSSHNAKNLTEQGMGSSSLLTSQGWALKAGGTERTIKSLIPGKWENAGMGKRE